MCHVQGSPYFRKHRVALDWGMGRSHVRQGEKRVRAISLLGAFQRRRCRTPQARQPRMVKGGLSPRGRQHVARLLLIVSRTEPSRFTYLKHVFGTETVDVLLDRRMEERRQSLERVGSDRRRLTERRQRDLTKDLQTYASALVRHE